MSERKVPVPWGKPSVLLILEQHVRDPFCLWTQSRPSDTVHDPFSLERNTHVHISHVNRISITFPLMPRPQQQKKKEARINQISAACPRKLTHSLPPASTCVGIDHPFSETSTPEGKNKHHRNLYHVTVISRPLSHPTVARAVGR